MENLKLHKVNADLRQSPAWSNYLKSLGWETHKLSNNSQLFFRKLGIFGKICKLQRPNNINLDEIDNFCTKNNILFIKIEPSKERDTPTLENYRFKPSKFPLLPPSTALIKLKMPLDQLENGLSSDVRYSIRKAKKDGVEVEFFQEPSKKQLDALWGVLKSSANRNNINSPSLTKLNLLVESFGDKSYLALAKNKEGKFTGGNFYVGHKNTVWYLFGGINKLGRKDTSGYKLMWESIKKLREFGYELLDLGGIEDKRFPKHTKSWGGFSKFKNKFAVQKIRFPKPYIKIYCKILKPFIN